MHAVRRVSEEDHRLSFQIVGGQDEQEIASGQLIDELAGRIGRSARCGRKRQLATGRGRSRLFVERDSLTIRVSSEDAPGGSQRRSGDGSSQSNPPAKRTTSPIDAKYFACDFIDEQHLRFVGR